MHSQIMFLKNTYAIFPNHAKAVQTSQWCGLNLPYTHQEHYGKLDLIMANLTSSWPLAITPTRTTQRLIVYAYASKYRNE